MSRWHLGLCALILAGLSLPGWALYSISERLLLPDGTPAAGAAVTLRLARGEKRKFEEIRLKADARGVFATSAAVDTTGIADLRAGYLLVDVPGCVLTVAELPVLRAGAAPETLQLNPDCPYACKVVDETGAPLVGATVSILQLGGTDSWGPRKALLNAPVMSLETPALAAKTDANGAFILRGATLVDDDHAGTANGGAYTPAKLAAFAMTPAGLLAGETDIIFHPANVPAGNPPKAVVVAPTLTVRGTVINAQTNTAVANAEITFAGDSVLASVLPPARSDARGMFEYQGLPRVSFIYAIAGHPATATGYAAVTQRLRNSEKNQLTRQITIRLKPLAPVTLLIVDAATNQQLAVPGLLNAIADDGVRAGSVIVGRDSTTGAATNGRVNMKMATERNRLELLAPGYHLAEESATLFVPPDGVKNITLKAIRDKGYLVQFATANPDGFFGTKLQVRTANGQVLTAGGALGIRPDGWWFAPAADLGDSVELRVLRGAQEVLPWTPLSPDPNKPPVTLTVK